MSTFNRLAGYSLSSWACACLVLWLIAFRGSAYTRYLRGALVGYVTTLSYGIYLLHPLIMRLVRSSREAYTYLREPIHTFSS